MAARQLAPGARGSRSTKCARRNGPVLVRSRTQSVRGGLERTRCSRGSIAVGGSRTARSNAMLSRSFARARPRGALGRPMDLRLRQSGAGANRSGRSGAPTR
eukprot:4780485-Pyramimonas_sp.AAC.2